jgi:hypothetical protein
LKGIDDDDDEKGHEEAVAVVAVPDTRSLSQ